MLRLSLAAAISSVSSVASAHTGHIDTVAGHSHYVGFAALFAAAVIVLGLLVKTKRARNV